MEKYLSDDEEYFVKDNNTYTFNKTELESNSDQFLQMQKFVSNDSDNLEIDEKKEKICFLESSASDNEDEKYLTSDNETLPLANVSVLCGRTRTSRRRSRRRISFDLVDELNDPDDDYVPSTFRNRRQNNPDPELPEPSRRRSTRSEAHNALNRISIYNNIDNNDENDEEEFEAEKVVNLDEISLASESEDAFITIEEWEKSRKIEKDSACTICAESKPINPVSAICCNQFIGCRNCVKKWYCTTNISHLNSRSPLSRGQSHDNHKRCPFCRTEWPNEMMVESVLIF